MISENRKPLLRSDIVWRKEGKNNKLICLTSYLGGPIYFLNPVASRIIELTNGKNTVKDIIMDVSKNFEEATPIIVKNDVINFLNTLKENKIIDF